MATDLIVRVAGKVLPAQAAPGHPGAFTIDLASVKPARTVALTWQIIDSHDGHVSDGTVSFHVRGQADDAAAVPAETTLRSEPGLLRPAEVTARIVGYLAMAVLIGGLLFVSLLWPAGAQERRTQRVLVGAVVAGASASVAQVAVVLWRADEEPDPHDRADRGLRSRAGGHAAAVAAGRGGRGRGPARRSLRRTPSALADRGAGRRHRADPGDRDDRPRQPGSRPRLGRGRRLPAPGRHQRVDRWSCGADDRRAARRRIEKIDEIVPRFSKVAQVSVLLIMASGLLLVWQLIWPIEGFWSTHYSRVLVVKPRCSSWCSWRPWRASAGSTTRSPARLPLVDPTRCSPSPPRWRRKPCWWSQFSGRPACWPRQAREFEKHLVTQLNTRGVAAESQSAGAPGVHNKRSKQ